MGVPTHMRHDLLFQFHDSPWAFHPGYTKTLKTILQKYYFPGITSFVRNYVASCKVCASHKNVSNLKPGFIQPIKSSSIMDTLIADILGPFVLLDSSQRPHKFYIHYCGQLL